MTRQGWEDGPAPLYAPGNAPARGTEGVPGAAPFVRGASACPRPFGLPWTLVSRVVAAEPAVANAEILKELKGGSEGIWLVLDASLRSGGKLPIAGDGLLAETAADLQRTLQGVLLDGIELHLDAGRATPRALLALERLAVEAGLEPAALQVHAGHDPAGMLLADGLAELDLPAPKTLFGGSAETLSALPLHLAGGDAVDALAYLLAAAAERLRAVEAAGGDPQSALGGLQYRVALDTDLLGSAVQVRALRGLVARLGVACGFEPAAARVHAVTSGRTLAEIDPWSNLLRGSYQTLAAVLGGADAITTLPFDSCAGRGSAMGRSIARNLHHVLAREAHLGAVVDPLGGSFAVEQRTADLEALAWERFRDVERDGGLRQLLEPGALERWLEPARLGRAKALARRAEPMLGVTQHVVLRPASPPAPDAPSARIGERLSAELVAELGPCSALTERDPLTPHRDAAPFEALRAATAAINPVPKVFLANLGRLREHKARSVFAADTLAVAGLESISGAGTPTVTGGAVVMQVVDQFRASGVALCCVCGSDEAYAEHGLDVVRALLAQGAQAVLVASKPFDEAETWRAAGLTEFMHQRSDLLQLFETLSESQARTTQEVNP